MKEISFPAHALKAYLTMWFTEAKKEWESYKDCLTKWQSLLETGMSAEDHFYNLKKWVARLIAYEDWADTNVQPAPYDTVELEVEDQDVQEAIEWIIQRTYRYNSADAYIAKYWTGLREVKDD